MNNSADATRPEDLPPVVLVTGPTASGKSGLALALAETFDGVVINADSMQVYRELAILTARPGPEALARAPHRLYGVLPGDASCSAGRGRALALAEIEAALADRRLPVVVGGTGLYLRALQRGLADLPEIPEQIRAAVRARHAALGAAAFHAALAARDPVMGARLHPSDGQRAIRAWEVLEATGRSLADWQAEQVGEAPPYRFPQVVLAPPRAALYAACDGRFETMLQRGALEEVRALLGLGLDPALPVMKALGVPELAAHLRDGLALDAAVSQAQQATRRYAKRQMTWLRTQGALAADAAMDVAVEAAESGGNSPIYCKNNSTLVVRSQYSESLCADIFNFIRKTLLTPPG